MALGPVPALLRLTGSTALRVSRQPVAATLLRPSLVVPLELARRTRVRFRARVSGDPTGAPDWVRAIAEVGEGDGWFEPDGVVWRVHGDLSTLAGGVAALLGQASAELAEQESARVRGMHAVVRGTLEDGRAYAASDPRLLRWVHLAFTDAFLHAQLHVGADLRPRFGERWPDAYVREWARSAEPLGATDLPTTAAELDEAIVALREELEDVPERLRSFLMSPPGLSLPERAFYATLSRAGGLLTSPTLAPLARVPGRAALSSPRRQLELQAVRAELAALHLALGAYSPSEEAARWRLGLGPAPSWAAP